MTEDEEMMTELYRKQMGLAATVLFPVPWGTLRFVSNA